jgi:hypothetical protein
MSLRNLSNMFDVIEQGGCKIILLKGAADPASTIETAQTSRKVASSSCSEPDVLVSTMRELAAARATILRIQREAEALRKGMDGVTPLLEPYPLLRSL